MCGIVAAVAQRNVQEILLEGLKRLEYRGYDSAGMTVQDGSVLSRHRAVGKVGALADKLAAAPLPGITGIAHTRWATHGKPTEANAHPHHGAERVAVVHNGIIENYEPIKQRLESDGVTFHSQTDTEVIAHLLDERLSKGEDLFEATRTIVTQLGGAYALGVMSASEPGVVVGARQGSPLVVGVGIDEAFLASDPMALLPVTDRFIYLEEGDLVVLREKGAISVVDRAGQPVERTVHTFEHGDGAASKGEYRHYMLKEIFEQPEVIEAVLEGRLSAGSVLVESFGPDAQALFQRARQIHVIACGTSFHAGLVARYWLERYAGIPVQVEVASEYRYRYPVVPEGTLFVALSQSGETADTLAALRFAKTLGYIGSLAICNVPGSSLVRESDVALMTRAGPEIGVASTKAFTTQLVALMLLTLSVAKARGDDDHRDIVEVLRKLPGLCRQVLALDGQIEALSQAFAEKQHALFLGRGAHYPVALEGALKLKEISYIHAEAYPAGELKHGPLALVDSEMPVISVAPNDDLLEKLKSNLQEVRARGGQLFVFADENVDITGQEGIQVLTLPYVHEALAPLLYTLPLQLLSYHVAVLKGTDVDQPRNLAKSVTVE
ncbi:MULTISPECIES: glutamine--fructose-6-phosphate transaminase (isomerizing) [unclassified Halomonas]|uniref:glutamine--fructose-6-phosphate transaminase (isomerizing) n=1 Tax=unclassified Halomonas TaxID=2609666 RepID=UPI0020A032D6|nr:MULTISPECIES: glutamine--fructose-6-phosphate transaminase (isomerizing) [unclassified Halomonas]MCP1313904.1 glutamine--fructose-6-phosphate transaminase (isomerizing) [Halomonas sp. 707D7]MCP1325987.1 glutamine--fructose-6-phosphate transaminase (isomerizing) [Halomonas sp. 707D4]